MAIGIRTPKIDNGYPLKKNFTKLFLMNPLIVLYLIVNHIYSYHSRECDPLT